MLKNYNYALIDLIQKPPHSHYDMVIELAEGQFIVEGRVSNRDDAVHYADMNGENKDVWDALDVVNKE